MIISLRRCGGYAGFDEPLGRRDLRDLGEDTLAQVVGMLKDLQHALQDRGPELGADLLRYELEVQEPDQAPRTLTILDEGDRGRPEMKILRQLASTLELPMA